MPQRVIITGGTGFIGSYLCRDLVASGYDVIVLTRNPDTARVPKGVRAVAWDGSSAKGWLRYAEKSFAIINLAGDNIAGGRWTAKKKKRIVESRINAGRAVADAVKKVKKKPKVIVQASAVGYYGNRGYEIVNENAAHGNGFLAGVVRAWEASSMDAEQRGVRRVIIRSGVVLGGDGGMFERLAPAFRLFAGGVPGSGRQWVSWIHIADEVRAIRFLTENKNARGVFNLTSPNPVPAYEFYRSMGALLRRPVWAPLKAPLLRLALGEMADEMILSGQRVVPSRLLELGFSFAYPGLSDALRGLARK